VANLVEHTNEVNTTSVYNKVNSKTNIHEYVYIQYIVISLYLVKKDLHCTTSYHRFRPLYMSTCVSQHLQLRTGVFCWCKVSLPACPCWRQQPAHSDYREDAGVLPQQCLHCLCTLIFRCLVTKCCNTILWSSLWLTADDHASHCCVIGRLWMSNNCMHICGIS